MDDSKDFYDELGEFTESEKEVIKRASMINTYRLIINNYDFNIFPSTMFWLLTEYDTKSVFDILMEYFESTEEYEICSDILKMKEHSDRKRKEQETKRGKLVSYLINPNDEQ